MQEKRWYTTQQLQAQSKTILSWKKKEKNFDKNFYKKKAGKEKSNCIMQ